MRTFSSLVSLSVILLPACESMVTGIPESRLPNADSKLVVQSFISPQAAYINVLVSESFPLFHKTEASIEALSGATVKISDGTHEAIIPFNKPTQTYTLESKMFKIEAGVTYYLNVSDGKRTVSAQCKVPKTSPVIQSYTIHPKDAMDANPEATDMATLTMSWDDVSGEANFYRTNAYMTIEHSVGDGFVDGKETEKRLTSRLAFYWDRHAASKELQHDEGLDGARFSSPPGQVIMPKPIKYPDGVESQIKPKPKLVSITMELFNAEENYFRYHHSLIERHDYTNPFTEPYLIYTNIQGGLGCFGAYNMGKLVYQPD